MIKIFNLKFNQIDSPLANRQEGSGNFGIPNWERSFADRSGDVGDMVRFTDFETIYGYI